ncbi:MAG TPA: hypothetical protein VF199_11720 [Bacillales bacterium]
MSVRHNECHEHAECKKQRQYLKRGHGITSFPVATWRMSANECRDEPSSHEKPIYCAALMIP